MMRNARNALALPGAMFLIFGLVFMGIALGVFRSNERLMENGVSVQGVYSTVGSKNAWFTFEAEGKVWERKSMVSSSSMHEGDEVTVWYPAGRPDQARITVWETWGVFLIVGGIFSVIGAGFLTAVLLGVMKKRSLVMNGTRVTAQVTDIVQNPMIRVNSSNPYQVHAVCVHPYTGQEMKVKSRLLMQKPSLNVGDEVEVMVDPMREHRYYVLIGEQ